MLDITPPLESAKSYHKDITQHLSKVPLTSHTKVWKAYFAESNASSPCKIGPSVYDHIKLFIKEKESAGAIMAKFKAFHGIILILKVHAMIPERITWSSNIFR